MIPVERRTLVDERKQRNPQDLKLSLPQAALETAGELRCYNGQVRP